MEFGLTGHVWSVAELLREAEATPPDLELLPSPPPPRCPTQMPGLPARHQSAMSEGTCGHAGGMAPISGSLTCGCPERWRIPAQAASGPGLSS